MFNRSWWRFLGLYGIPKGESPLFYRDVALAVIFMLAMFVALLASISEAFSLTQFIVAAAIAVGCLIAATDKRTIVGGLFLFLAIRFGFSLLVSGRLLALAGLLVCLGCV